MKNAIGWFGRILILVLAVSSTLSIIGSIAAIPSGGTASRTLFGEAAPPAYEAETPAPEQTVEPAPEQTDEPTPGEAARTVLVEPSSPQGAGSGPVSLAPAPPEDPVARWLEPIAYALIAIAGLLAVGVLLLWRIGSAIIEH